MCELTVSDISVHDELGPLFWAWCSTIWHSRHMSIYVYNTAEQPFISWEPKG